MTNNITDYQLDQLDDILGAFHATFQCDIGGDDSLMARQVELASTAVRTNDVPDIVHVCSSYC